MSGNISPEALANGSVLLYLKSNLIKEATQENLFPLLSCLRDSVVHVPFNAIMSETDQERIIHCKVGDAFSNQDDVRLKPDLLQRPDGVLFFPLFSQVEQIPDGYKEHFSILPIEALRCLQMAHATEGVIGLVLDAFTEPLMLTFQLADIMGEIPSRLERESE